MKKILTGLLALISLIALSGHLAVAQTTMDGSGEGSVISAEDANSDLESILARQRGEDLPRLPRDFDSALDQAQGISNMLGVLGGASDAEVWEALRFGTADVTVSAGGDPARVLMQDRGMWWQEFRKGPVSTYGGWLLLGTIGFLALFYLVRGRIRVSHGLSGEKILRFNSIERFAHWVLAGSFILLGVTGIITLLGRRTIGLIEDPETYAAAREIYAILALYSKWVHNNVSWAFILGLVMVFFLWVIHNIPNRHDLVWFAKGGGIIGKAHPPAKKFNAGQKIIFWSVVLLGGSIAASGLALLFPFEINMFAATFEKLNAFGVPGLLNLEPFPTQLAPHEEMQFAQLWHAIVSFLLMAIIIAHIYIGSLGMEAAFDAMGDGEVDLNWAKHHHSLWVEEVQVKQAASDGAEATPAE